MEEKEKIELKNSPVEDKLPKVEKSSSRSLKKHKDHSKKKGRGGRC